MADLCVLLLHSTDDPDRAVAGLRTAVAAASSGRPAGLWLSSEGVRLGARGVAETLSNADGRPDVRAMLEEFARRGGRVFVEGPSWRERGFGAGALVEGAEVVEPERLAALAGEGFAFASY